MTKHWNKLKRALSRQAWGGPGGSRSSASPAQAADRRRRHIERQIEALRDEICALKGEISLDDEAVETDRAFDLRQRLIRSRDLRYKVGLLEAELTRVLKKCDRNAEETGESHTAFLPDEVREAAERLLAGVVNLDEAARPAVEKAAVDLLSRKSTKYVEAFESLRELRLPECAGLFRAALDCDDDAIRAASVQALADLGEPEADTLIGRCLESSSHRLRLAALRGLYNQKSPHSAEACLKCLVDESPEVRRTAAVFLGLLKSQPAAPALAALLKDESTKVRLSAARALELLPSEQNVYTLIRALEDDEVAVRTAAKAALSKALAVPLSLDVNQEPNRLFPNVEALLKWWSEARPKGEPWHLPALHDYTGPRLAGEQ